MKKFLLSIFAMFIAFANLQAEEVTVYTLEPAEGSNNSYAGNCDIAIGDITWNLTGNSQINPWRIGGKSITNVDRALYSKNPMVGAVDKVVLSIGTVNSITVNSAKLLVADNADFTNAVETPFTVTANSDSEIAVTAPAGSYYKFVFNVTVSGSSNKFIQISKAVFYSSTSGETTAAAAPSLPADCSFTESKTIEITNNEEGATVYYTTDGENFNEYVGEFTINETTTVRAYAQIGDDVATKSYEVERTYTKLEAKTIAEVIEAGVGEAYTKGTVVATYAKGFLLNDETGYILVYQGNAPTVAEGDVININGTTSMYGGLLQFAAGAIIEKTGTAEVAHPEAVVMDGAAFDAFLTAPEVKYVEYIGTLTINGNYYNVAVEGAETAIASIQYPNDGLVTVESGEVIKVTGYTIGYNKDYVNTMAVKVEAYVEPEPEPEPEVEYATAEAIAALQASINEADAILAEVGYKATSTSLVAINIKDNADAMLYSNAACTNTAWGDEFKSWTVLFDDNTETIFHSEYDNGTGLTSVDGLDHYLRVDLGEGNELAQFAFTFTTRSKNCDVNSPTTIVVEGCNEADGEYTEIATITDIPQENSYKFESDVLSTADGTAYRYIRFRVTATGTNQTDGGGKVFFFISEFGMSKVETSETPEVSEEYAADIEKYTALAVANNAAKAVVAEETPLAEAVAAAQAALDAAIEALEPAEPEVDEATIALIATAKELIALEGIGYPAVAPRAELQAAIDAAEAAATTEAGTALQAAINAYYATTDVVLPEGDKVYSLTMVAKNGNKFYLNYTGSDIAMVARTTDEELPNSAKFAAEDNGDGTISLKTIDGKYLVYHSKYAGVNWLQGGGDTDGLQETKDDMTNITFAKMVNGDKVEATGNEQIFGMLTWYGKRGFDTGKSIDCYGYMVLMTDGSDYDGASVPFWNDGYSSAFIVEETEYPAEPLKVVAVTPAEDEVVNSLREITIEFDAEIAVKELSDTERINIQYLGTSNVLIGTTATVEGNTLKLVADSEIKDSGKHTLVIPAGVVTRVSDGVAYEGGTFTFTVEKAAVVVEPLTVVAVTPAESVEKLETITIEFSDKVDVPATASGKFTIDDADGNNVATLYAWDAAVDGNVVTLTLTEAITEAGEYTFSFAEGLVTRQGDGATCAYTCTINVTGVVGIDSIYGEAGDSVIYDITGRKIEKITEGGIYIVNGKKVLVK